MEQMNRMKTAFSGVNEFMDYDMREYTKTHSRTILLS
eukprot:CAMPEP_0172521286 /NCGR_PEP_ID=MMETSP1066-20121228/292496_1 /TAXON_ID=671091 /ORGANISM="Coscinodiscus wailesii, Strain CCMP2513" /LENGTH=36 /DNA_ID= /DNA_START= /DNA_END= /DNA_ORIENTATION=